MGENEENKDRDLHSKEGLGDFFSNMEMDMDDGEYDIIDQQIDELMAFLEGYGDFSGGIVTLDTIHDFLNLLLSNLNHPIHKL